MADTYAIEIDVSKATRNLRAIGAKGLKAAGSGLLEHLEDVMTKAKLQTPVDEGTLRSSAVTLGPVESGSETTVAGGFGGAAAKYALYQHEDLWWNKETGAAEHKILNHTVGKSKYLEDPFNELLPQAESRVGAHVKRALGL